RRRRGARLRRDRRVARRRRRRSRRRRGVHALALAAQSPRGRGRDRLHQRALAGPERAVARRPERGRRRHLPRSPHEAPARLRARVRARAALALGARGDRPGDRRDLPAGRGVCGARADRGAPALGQGRPRAVKALVTGAAGGIGRALVARLEAEGYEVAKLDLVDGFDVSDPGAWSAVGPVDLACLNAGVLTGETDIRVLTDAQYRHALGVNVDGVVFGVRRLATVMERGSIVVTASLAGLTGMPGDAVYSLTK